MDSEKCLKCVWCQDHIDFIYCPLPYCMKTFDLKKVIDQQDIIDTEELNT